MKVDIRLKKVSTGMCTTVCKGTDRACIDTEGATVNVCALGAL